MVDQIITKGLYHFCVQSDHPRITGNTGNTQGASTLSNHAINVNSSNVMNNKI
jgi:hypothetical protein